MKHTGFSIPNVKFENDFTIIYKGIKDDENEDKTKEEIIEIKTSKDELLRRLRCLKSKSNEFKYINEYFIHDEFRVSIFQEFIESIQTSKIDLNENNYLDHYKLSIKYEYTELKEIVDDFINNRPDLQQVIVQLLNSNKSESILNIDFEKEKIIAKNLDFFLNHRNFSSLPLTTLNRILNSPYRVLNNHHLLFKFVTNTISELIKQKNSQSSELKENIEIMIGALDYNEMTADEILELLENEQISSFSFGPRNSKDKLKSIIIESKKSDMQIKKLEAEVVKQRGEIDDQKKETANLKQKMIHIESKFDEQSRIIEKLLNEISELATKQKVDEINRKIESNQLICSKNQKEIESIENRIQKLEKNDEELNRKFECIESKSIDCSERVIKYLTKIAGGNVNDKGVVDVFTNSIYPYGINIHPKNIADLESDDYFISYDKPNSWICYDFKKRKIRPIKYFLRSMPNGGKGYANLSNWVIEGSNTGSENDWITLDTRIGETCLDEYKASHTFDINLHLKENEYYRFLRIRQTGKNIWGSDS